MNRILVYGMTNNLGGIETYLINQAKMLDKNKAVFDFVTDFSTMVYENEVSALGSKIYYIPAKKNGVLAQWKAFAKILRDHKEYKTVYFNILDAGAAITMFIPWLFGRTIVTHSHNNDTEKRKLHRLCKPFLNLFTSERFACSPSAAKYMFGNRKATVIPNAIDAKRFKFNPAVREDKRKELGVADRFVICHVGRLAPQKNPKGLIDIFDSLYKADRSAVLLSVGDGEMADEVHLYAKSKPCCDAIRFLGRRGDIHEILQAADVFLFPSFYEGLGIVAIEAQAAGLPCVLSDVIPKEVAVTDNVFYLSLSEPPEKWAKTLLSLKNSNRLSDQSRLREAGYDSSFPSEAQRYLKNYFELVNKRGSEA